MNFYDVLAAEKWGGGIPTTNFFDLLFAQFISGEKWEIYEGTLPATLNANGDNMRQYKIYGNTGGVGDRTVNLLDKRNIESNMYVRVEGAKGSDNNWSIYYVTATNGEQYTATGVSTINSSAYIGYADANKNILGIVGTALGATPQTVTMPEIGTFLAVSVRKSATTPMLTPGATPPETFAPFGYEVDMVSRTRNLFDMYFYKGISGITVLGNKVTGTCDRFFNVRLSLPAKLYEQELTWSVYIKRPDSPGTARVQTVDSGIYKYGNDITGEGRSTVRLTATSTTRLYINYSGTGTDTIELSDIMLNVGSTALPYEPYSNAITPIYIGDEPLDKDEYVDYQTQKVYRMIDGILTPTDPPVPLPALPTCEGTTIVDYAGSGTAPEKVYFEYQGGKQP